MALARLQGWLFAHHPIAFDQVDHPAPVGDPPVPGQQLHRPVRTVLDPDVIDPEPFARAINRAGMRLFRQKVHGDPHSDPVGYRRMLKKRFHKPQGSNAARIRQWASDKRAMPFPPLGALAAP